MGFFSSFVKKPATKIAMPPRTIARAASPAGKMDTVKPKQEAQKMGRSTTQKLESAQKWIGKYGQEVGNGKAALSALESAKKSAADTAALRVRLGESVAGKKAAMLALQDAFQRAKTERKLKLKEARVQAKIAALSVAPRL